MDKKADFYKWVKLAGMISFIPFVLISGPLGGFIIGEYLKVRFGLGYYAVYVFVFLGFATSLFEIVRIIRLLTRMDKS